MYVCISYYNSAKTVHCYGLKTLLVDHESF